MYLIREFEDQLRQYKMDRKIYGMVHCCNGQEAVAATMCQALDRHDYVVTTHRPHGHAIAKGADINKIMAEILGRSTGTNGGKGGSMHIVDTTCGLIMATGIVGSGIPIACGAAFSAKYKKNGKIACVFMGDGSANEGTFCESLNLAAKWELPLIFVVEDNGLAVTTLSSNTSACQEYTALARAYGIYTIKVDGQDAEECYAAAREAVTYVRSKCNPVLVHAKTIRFCEHAEGEYYFNMRNSGYRDITELNLSMQNKCPIQLFSLKTLSDGRVDLVRQENLLLQAKKMVKSSLDYAIQAPLADSQCAFEHVYSEGVKK